MSYEQMHEPSRRVSTLVGILSMVVFSSMAFVNTAGYVEALGWRGDGRRKLV
jgi:hypothetical protein